MTVALRVLRDGADRTLICIPHAGGSAGSFCNGRPSKNASPQYNDLQADLVTPNPNYSTNQIGNADPARYYKGSPYCAGDIAQTGLTCPVDPTPCGKAFNTQFDVLAADATPNDPTDNPVLSSGQCGANGAPWDIPGEYQQNPPPPDWNGAYQLLTK